MRPWRARGVPVRSRLLTKIVTLSRSSGSACLEPGGGRVGGHAGAVVAAGLAAAPRTARAIAWVGLDVAQPMSLSMWATTALRLNEPGRDAAWLSRHANTTYGTSGCVPGRGGALSRGRDSRRDRCQPGRRRAPGQASRPGVLRIRGHDDRPSRQGPDKARGAAADRPRGALATDARRGDRRRPAPGSADRKITDLGQAGGSSRRSRLLYCGCGCGGRGQAAGVRVTVKPRASSWRMWLRAFLPLSMRSA